MKKSFALFLLLSCVWSVTAQDFTFKNSGSSMMQGNTKVLIIPFEDRMFISDINKEIANRTGMSLQEIKSTFQSGLVQTISEMGADHGDYMDPFEMDQAELEKILGTVYSGLNYDYQEVEELDEVKDQRLLDKLNQKTEKSQVGRGAYVEDGQLHSWYDKKERFMQARLKPEIVKSIIEEYNLDFLLILTELDIQVMRDVNRDVGQVWPRRVKVHFSVYDKDGKLQLGSAAYNYYDGSQKDIYSIIRKSFDFPAAQIITAIENKQSPQDLDKKNVTESETTRSKEKKFSFNLFKEESSDEDY